MVDNFQDVLVTCNSELLKFFFLFAIGSTDCVSYDQ